MLEGASLTVGDGEFVSLVGPSGSGYEALWANLSRHVGGDDENPAEAA